MEKPQLRKGFTTGTCAAAAAKAAAAMVLTGNKLQHIKLRTPKGTEADLSLFHVAVYPERAVCAVKKDAGDDPDITDQALIFASVKLLTHSQGTEKDKAFYVWEEKGKGPLFLFAGQGVGRVTKPGLSCPVGKPAINPVPRKMIFEGVLESMEEAGFEGPLSICIWIPEGERLAEKTFNPKLGITGGLSILGTTGIVEPMSEEALKATIRLELHMKAVAGCKHIILTPGNYGEAFLKEALGLSLNQGVICSNFIADSLAMAGREGFGKILLAGHIGKLIKTAGGVPNTHSKYGDRRMEILWDCASRAITAKEGLEKRLLQANTTEEAVALLQAEGILEPVMEEAVKRIQGYAAEWSKGAEVEVVMFSTVYGILGMSPKAKELIKYFLQEEQP